MIHFSNLYFYFLKISLFLWFFILVDTGIIFSRQQASHLSLSPLTSNL